MLVNNGISHAVEDGVVQYSSLESLHFQNTSEYILNYLQTYAKLTQDTKNRTFYGLCYSINRTEL